MMAQNSQTAEPLLTTADNAELIWQKVLQQLLLEYGEATYRSWFSKLHFIEQQENQIVFASPTRFIGEWITSHYQEKICRLWQQEDVSVHSIRIIVQSSGPLNTSSSLKSVSGAENNSPATIVPWSGALSEVISEPASKATTQRMELPKSADAKEIKPLFLPEESFYGSLDPRFTFEQFIVGNSNALAYAAAKSVADSLVPQPEFNPLYIYGGVGLGKTHLLQAIALHIQRQFPKRKVLYLSAEKFMFLFVRAIRSKEVMAFKEYFRFVDVLLIDDIQFICGKESTQEEFFHTFNAIIDNNRQLIISCDRAPGELQGMEERIKSRLGWGLVADIQPASYELRLGILRSKAEQSSIHIPFEVIEFLASKITSNIRELEGALNKVIAQATFIGGEVTLSYAQEVLKDMLKVQERCLTIDEIQKKVADFFNVRVTDLSSQCRARAVARPRQIAMYFAKQFTTKSLAEIGKKFGGKDHTTVMHALKKVESLKLDKEFSMELQKLTSIFDSY